MVIEGYLEMFDLLTLISFLSYSNKSGILILNVNHNEGIIFFNNGNVIDAFIDGKQGEEALTHLVLNYSIVSFCFSQGKVLRENKINKSSEKLILELLKVFDENNNKNDKEIVLVGG